MALFHEAFFALLFYVISFRVCFCITQKANKKVRQPVNSKLKTIHDKKIPL